MGLTVVRWVVRCSAGPRTATFVLSRPAMRLQIIIVILAGQGHGRSLVHLLPVLLEKRLVDLGRGGSKSGSGDEFLGLLDTEPCSHLEDRRDAKHTRDGLPTSLRASQRNGFSKL